ncbi:MAG: hypothetical protein WBA93_30655, partial [Microcoleaceae cyanobacterium]
PDELLPLLVSVPSLGQLPGASVADAGSDRKRAGVVAGSDRCCLLPTPEKNLYLFHQRSNMRKYENRYILNICPEYSKVKIR